MKKKQSSRSTSKHKQHEKEKEKEKEDKYSSSSDDDDDEEPEKKESPSDLELRPLKEFCEAFERWLTTEAAKVDARTYSVSLAHTLQAFVLNNKDVICQNPNVILVVGHQSAGKTTQGMSLTQQVVFLVDPKTGTKAATLITANYVPNETQPKLSFTYSHIQKKHLTTDQMMTLYSNTFKDADFDEDNMASVVVESPVPSFGISILDHPGFVLADVKNSCVRIAQKSIDRYFRARRSAGIILLCHSITHSPDDGGWSALKHLHDVPEGHFFVAITRMDRLQVTEISNRIFSDDEKGKKYRRHPEDESKICMTALEILQFIEREMKQTGHLPAHAQFFFVASSDATMEQLQRESAEDRWTLFRNREEKNQLAMRKLLEDAPAWEEYNIVLEPMNDSQLVQFEDRLGQAKLFACLLRRQHQGSLAVTKEIGEYVQQRAAEERERYGAILRSLSKAKSLPALVSQFIDQFVQFYHTLASTRPYDGTCRGEEGINLKAIYDKIEKGLGWTADEERNIYSCLKEKAIFPPSDRRLDNFEQVLNKGLDSLVRPKDIKLHTLSTLIRRMEAEYAFLSSCIAVPEVTGEEILRKTGTIPGLQAGDVKDPLAAHIANEYNKLYHSKWKAGNLYAALRCAMCILMHAQTVAEVLCRVPDFQDLFVSEDMGLDKCRLDLINDLIKTGGGAPHNDNDERVEVRPKSLSVRLGELVSNCPCDVPSGTPRSDLSQAILAMFFHSPVEGMKELLDNLTLSLALTQPAFVASSLHFAPLFLHQDCEFLQEYQQHNASDEYAQAFLGRIHQTPRGGPPAWTLMELTMVTTSVLEMVMTPATRELPKKFHDAMKEAMNAIKGAIDDSVVTLLKDKLEKLALGDSIGHAVLRYLASLFASASNFSPSGLLVSALQEVASEVDFIPQLLMSTKQHQDRISVRHDYGTDTEASLFSWCKNEKFEEVAEMIHTLEPLEAWQQARLLSSLIRMAAGPDIVSHIQSAADTSGYETRWLNYANRRYITAGIYNSLHGTLRTITSFTYPYVHPQTTGSHQSELRGRFVSILLGYGHPYKEEERPSSKWYLNPDAVIPFLMRYCDDLTSENSALDDIAILDIDRHLSKSPLLKCIMGRIKSAPQPKGQSVPITEEGLRDSRKDAYRLIHKLYEAWKTKNEDLLNTILIEVLSTHRYQSISPKEMKVKLKDEQKNRCYFWQKVDGCLQSYIRFLEKHGSSLTGLAELPPNIRKLRPSPPPPIDLDEGQAYLDDTPDDTGELCS